MCRLALLNPRALSLIALLAATAPLLQAQVRIAPCPSELESDQTFDLTDQEGDGRSRKWSWSLEALGSGRLEPRGDGSGVRYCAPTVHRSRTFHIRATDLTGATDTIPVRVRPSQTQLDAMGWMLAPGAGLAGVMGLDWDLPQVTRFPGKAGKGWSNHCLKKWIVHLSRILTGQWPACLRLLVQVLRGIAPPAESCQTVLLIGQMLSAACGRTAYFCDQTSEQLWLVSL